VSPKQPKSAPKSITNEQYLQQLRINQTEYEESHRASMITISQRDPDRKSAAFVPIIGDDETQMILESKEESKSPGVRLGSSESLFNQA
jgi:hypothetical protein